MALRPLRMLGLLCLFSTLSTGQESRFYSEKPEIVTGEPRKPKAKPDTSILRRGPAPQWIWGASANQNCYLRKEFDFDSGTASIQATCDNEMTIYLNGHRIGQSGSWENPITVNVSKHLKPGKNLFLIQAVNKGGPAGFALKLAIKPMKGKPQYIVSDKSWTFAQKKDAQKWQAVKTLGRMGSGPWGNVFANPGGGVANRGIFNHLPGFQIEKLFTVPRGQLGSWVSITFDNKGRLLASDQGGRGICRITPPPIGSDKPTKVEHLKVKMTSAQGMLYAFDSLYFSVNGGPGSGLYRARDTNGDDQFDQVVKLKALQGGGEHGPHALRLSPDGKSIYLIAGNHTNPPRSFNSSRVPKNWSEDLLLPRQWDANGHARGKLAPGGWIARTDPDGKTWDVFSIGYRNPYDMDFNADGELFAYDADMEWDMGSPWYRPTRINHVTAGAELGWRSGWAKWPSYFLDSLPAAIHMGAGSPTGVEFYDHNIFPEQYHGAMFACDWASGLIHAVKLERSGATYKAASEVFLAGRPLNATDLAVGPDGALYFCTGGRGTDGGVYRVRWTGATPLATNEAIGTIASALQQPQLDADWARAAIAKTKAALGEQWGPELEQVALDVNRSLVERQRAVNLMVYFGPRPSDQLLLQLTSDTAAEIRAQAARLMSSGTATASAERLAMLLADSDPLVRRAACESITRLGTPLSADKLVPLLGDEDRFVAFAAQRALQQQPQSSWARQVVESEQSEVFCQGAVALLSENRDPAVAQVVLTRCQAILQKPTESDSQLLNVLRISQLALALGQLAPGQAPSLGDVLLGKYPTGNLAVDRELVRLLVFLQVPGAADKFAAQLSSELEQSDKLHVAAYASLLETGWTINTKLALMKFFEEVRGNEGGYSVSAYVENFSRDFFTKFSLAERQQVLAAGERWPTSSLSVLAKLPADPPAELLAELRTLDGKVQPLCAESDAFRRLRVGIFAVLGRSSDPASAAYLRQVYSTSPEDRHTVAMSLTQHPEGENWPYLVDSLKTVDGRVAQEILRALATVPQRPQEPEPYRQVILQGLRLGDEGASLALTLLDHWAGQTAASSYPDWSARLVAWQQWYATNFPAAPPAELPVDSTSDKWSYNELLNYLTSDAARSADAERGREAFELAQCAKCHRCNGVGETLGPDLTSVSRRFQRQEILEAIVYPSHNISDQYASRVVMSHGRTFAGLVVPRGSDGVTVLMADGEKVDIPQSDIDDIRPSPTSAMPSGLLNRLSLEQVGQLFAYLESAGDASLAQRAGGESRQ